MHDEIDAVHAAIWANTADPLPRLAYADWLDDHGEADYAELIRFEDALDRGRLTREMRRTCRVRRRELSERLRADWGFDHLPFRRQLTFERGLLPDHIHLDAADLIQWERWPPYLRPRELTVSGYVGLEQEVVACPYLGRVERLAMTEPGDHQPAPVYPPDSDPLLDRLSRCGHLNRLRHLRLDVRPSRCGLTQFADSKLADRLPALELLFVLDSSRECVEDYHTVDVRQPPAGAVRAAILEFVDEFADRLPP